MGAPSKQFVLLKDQWQKRHSNLEHRLWIQHADALETVKSLPQQLLVGSLASLVMFTNQVPHGSFAQVTPQSENRIEITHTQEELVARLSRVLPGDIRPLSPDEDSKIGALLTDFYKMPVWSVLAGNQLNRTYGYIGAEQHLARYPGDTMETHFQTAEEAAATGRSEMAPGRGAWGHFAASRDAMTQRDADREKYYLAVQTFLSPGWAERTNELYAFFKFRKMLIVNPDNGNAMVVVIGDAGPSAATGKHLGGSPEVMKYLRRVDGAQKGAVLYYFIDDPDDTIPLGPITIK